MNNIILTFFPIIKQIGDIQAICLGALIVFPIVSLYIYLNDENRKK